MPVRNIPKNYSNLTGRLAAEKRIVSYQFESTLERDALFFFDMDLKVDFVEEQPVIIPYIANGKKKTYTPDLLVVYKRQLELKPVLIEVKYVDELKAKEKELEEKFNAAKEYCNERDWIFKTVTEKDIRTPRLDNLKFLKNYKNFEFNFDTYQMIDSFLDGSWQSVQVVLDALTKEKWVKAKLISDIWTMVLKGYLDCDLESPLTMSTKIRIDQ